MNRILKGCRYILGIWWVFFSLFVGISLFYFGTSRISMGIDSVSISDIESADFIAHYMRVGLLYIKISLLILIALTIAITYSLSKHVSREIEKHDTKL